jgi:hypothetical protein
MKAVKIAVIVLLVYAGIVTAFESLIGFMQPTPDSTLVITTFDESGTPHDRVVSRLDSGGSALRVGEPLAARVVPARAGEPGRPGDDRRPEGRLPRRADRGRRTRIASTPSIRTRRGSAS